jgi:predicted ATPase
MYISRLILSNWRNFQRADTPLEPRVFIVGPNGSGKSNLLDVFRFLRDVAKNGGGLQEAVKQRGGVSKIRCLSARGQSDITIEVHLSDDETHKVKWKYKLAFTQTGGGVFDKKAKLRSEEVWDKNGKLICQRPDTADKRDEKLLEYTWLEQPTSNSAFRDVADFFDGIQYLHIVPQLLRDPKSFVNGNGKEDFFGRDFLERINRTNKKTRDSFLKRIERVLRIAIPQFSELKLVKDNDGVPHLQAKYKHWRAGVGAKQWENQFSDGTLRLIGFLWALQDGNKPILLEEPELSLHTGIVKHIAATIARLQKKKTGTRQVILTTNSFDLLTDGGISLKEVLMLNPTDEGTMVTNPDDDDEIKALLEGGLTMADVIHPRTTPKDLHQFVLEI